MASRRVVRFSLASLLGLITLAAVALGYTKWKVEQSQQRLEELKSAGMMVSLTSRETGWLEYVATGKKDVRLARQIILSVRIFDDGYLIGDRLPFGEERLSKAEMLAKVKKLADRINALSPSQFYIRVMGDNRDAQLVHDLRAISGAHIEWLPPAIPEYGEF